MAMLFSVKQNSFASRNLMYVEKCILEQWI